MIGNRVILHRKAWLDERTLWAEDWHFPEAPHYVINVMLVSNVRFFKVMRQSFSTRLWHRVATFETEFEAMDYIEISTEFERYAFSFLSLEF